MLAISEDGRSFSVSRGEKADLNIVVFKAPKIKYTLNDNDVLTLYVRRKPDIRSEIVIEKSGSAGSNIITLEAEDTEWLREGTYSAVVCLDIPDDNVVKKPVWPFVKYSEIEKQGYGLPANNMIIREGVTDFGG